MKQYRQSVTKVNLESHAQLHELEKRQKDFTRSSVVSPRDTVRSYDSQMLGSNFKPIFGFKPTKMSTKTPLLNMQSVMNAKNSQMTNILSSERVLSDNIPEVKRDQSIKSFVNDLKPGQVKSNLSYL